MRSLLLLPQTLPPDDILHLVLYLAHVLLVYLQLGLGLLQTLFHLLLLLLRVPGLFLALVLLQLGLFLLVRYPRPLLHFLLVDRLPTLLVDYLQLILIDQ